MEQSEHKMEELAVEETKHKMEEEVEQSEHKLKEKEVEKSEPKKVDEVKKTNVEEDAGGVGQEDVHTRDEQNPSKSPLTDQYFTEELFEDLSSLRPFFDSCFVMESEKEDSKRNPVCSPEQEVCLKPRIIRSEQEVNRGEERKKRCLYYTICKYIL